VVDSSGKDFFLGVEVLELFCNCCLWFWTKVVWVLWVIRVPLTKVVIVSWYFGFPIGVEGSVVILSEFYPKVIVSFCDKFYREFPLSWLIDIIACS